MPASRGVKRPIPADRITKWIIDNKVLSIALGGLCVCVSVLLIWGRTSGAHTITMEHGTALPSEFISMAHSACLVHRHFILSIWVGVTI